MKYSDSDTQKFKGFIEKVLTEEPELTTVALTERMGKEFNQGFSWDKVNAWRTELDRPSPRKGAGPRPKKEKPAPPPPKAEKRAPQRKSARRNSAPKPREVPAPRLDEDTVSRLTVSQALARLPTATQRSFFLVAEWAASQRYQSVTLVLNPEGGVGGVFGQQMRLETVDALKALLEKSES